MNTIYLLDALFLLLAGVAALFAFGTSGARGTRTWVLLVALFCFLFLVTLLIGFLSQPSLTPPLASD